jgi:hypothetical protein
MPEQRCQILVIERGTQERSCPIVEGRLRNFLVGTAAVVAHGGQPLPFCQPADVGVVPDLIRRLEERCRPAVQEHEKGEGDEEDAERMNPFRAP